mmetsp:Transcript_4833/g.10088  ORF Transcript_4833/g.10088 Transcript_4833/m.10088 type:complete len:174 (-) Transcript_4833:35-556(-)
MLILIPRLLSILRFAPRLLFGLWRGAKFACLAFADKIFEGVQNGLKFLSHPAPVPEPAWQLLPLAIFTGNIIIATLLVVAGATVILFQTRRLKMANEEVANLRAKLQKLEHEASPHDENIENKPPNLIADKCKSRMNQGAPSSPKRRSVITPLMESPLDNVKRGGFLKEYWPS